ncbi:ATP-dependent DNA helicase RecG [Pullulanibacillus camelliae]|uniref:ATP-dependent DNA helicase RecG n=1 Tax=Pullulanibacillus camelliae TaxID=1707096 RepID=A0A8J2W1J7_9BACL|nr:ATP-dependent DNA helicase RecG [Pullulanibacillus camelliae]GGE41885.1 ATP-dependent DNA helicase RecG [Pullulanibacillus camelliae]
MLESPVTVIKGIGSETAADLQALGVYTVDDLLMHFPYRYESYHIKDLAQVQHDDKITVKGKVHSEPSLRFYGRKKSRLSFRMFVGELLITAIAFNRAFLKKKITIGETVIVTGKWDAHRAQLSIVEIQFGDKRRGRLIEPVYQTKGSLTVKSIRKYVLEALNVLKQGAIEDPLPVELRQSYKLPDRLEAIQTLHFPDQRDKLKHARRRMVYEELFYFQLKMQLFKYMNRQQGTGLAIPIQSDSVQEFIKQLPFKLTEAQKRVTKEILHDLSSPFRMNRLLQGDVGSGKTVIAAIALFAVMTCGFQGALMVPTEILAEQHAENLYELLQPFGCSVALLTSRVKGKRRQALLEELQAGDIDVLVGTHALIQEEVVFKKLGLVIADEQHRFGVNQRRALRSKGMEPDVLHMTATPIPRTLAISAFGDMDISTIDELPSGRKKIQTRWVKHDQLSDVLSFVSREIQNGRQAYVICPLIEESEQLDVQNAIDVHAQLTQAFPTLTIGLMHGRLTSEEKDQVMEAFKNNTSQILVSTTVVEVGVNVPNATVMIIYDAERFGLAQLHQLRGRVGRGSHQSYCILISDAHSEVSKERMRIMTETTDGFELSEFDLKLRGPGDFFGKKQSGLPDFKIADIVHDFKALDVARKDVERILDSGAFWDDPDYALIRKKLEDQGVFAGERLD